MNKVKYSDKKYQKFLEKCIKQHLEGKYKEFPNDLKNAFISTIKK